MSSTRNMHMAFLRSGGGLAQILASERFMQAKAAEAAQAMAPTVANQPAPPPKPEGMPEGAQGWRANFQELAPQIAASPLGSRQQRRAAGIAVAKQLNVVQGIEARKQAKLERKRRRAFKHTSKASASSADALLLKDSVT